MNESIQVAIGSVLGDGFLHKLSKRKSGSQLYVSQQNSKLPYLEWLHSELRKSIQVNPIKPKKGYQQHWFLTKSDPRLGDLKQKFYYKAKKIIPSNIKELLNNPLSLAVWYMDDGTLDKRNKYHFNSMIASYCFTFNECEILKSTLEENFGINVSVTKCNMRGKLYPRIYIKSESMENFIKTIEPFIHPVFRYKIGIQTT